MLHPGLYEQVINNALTRELAEIPEARKAVAPIDKAEASKVLAQYLADVIQKGLDNVLDNGGDISAQIELSNRIVNLIQSTTKEPDFAALGVDERAEQLFGADWENIISNATLALQDEFLSRILIYKEKRLPEPFKLRFMEVFLYSMKINKICSPEANLLIGFIKKQEVILFEQFHA